MPTPLHRRSSATSTELAARRAAVHRTLQVAPRSELAAAKLELDETRHERGGGTPKGIAADEAGRSWMTKRITSADPLALAASKFAERLLTASDEPTVPVFGKHVEWGKSKGLLDMFRSLLGLSDGADEQERVVPTYSSPLIENHGVLPMDVSLWTPEEVSCVLASAPYLEVTGNYDAKPDQYLRVATRGESLKGSRRAAVNIDWDHAGRDYFTDAPLTRFKRYSGLLQTPAPNLLYKAYVRGTIDLDFTPMFESISRIEQLSDDFVRKAALKYGEQAKALGKLKGKFASPEAFADAVVARKNDLRPRFERLVADLKEERLARQGVASPAVSAAVLGWRMVLDKVHGSRDHGALQSAVIGCVRIAKTLGALSRSSKKLVQQGKKSYHDPDDFL